MMTCRTIEHSLSKQIEGGWCSDGTRMVPPTGRTRSPSGSTALWYSDGAVMVQDKLSQNLAHSYVLYIRVSTETVMV